MDNNKITTVSKHSFENCEFLLFLRKNLIRTSLYKEFKKSMLVQFKLKNRMTQETKLKIIIQSLEIQITMKMIQVKINFRSPQLRLL